MHLIDVQNYFYQDIIYYKREINYLNKQITLYEKALQDLENKSVSDLVKDLIYEKYHINNNKNIGILYGIIKNDLFTLQKRLELIYKKYSVAIKVFNALKYRQEIGKELINAIKDRLIQERVSDVDLIKVMELIKVRNGNVLINEKDAIFSEDLFLVLNMLNQGYEQITVPDIKSDKLDNDVNIALNILESNSLGVASALLDFTKYSNIEQEYIYKSLLVFYQNKMYNLINVLKEKKYYFDIELLKQIKDEYKEIYAIYMFLRNRLDSINLVSEDAVMIDLADNNVARNLYYSSNSDEASKCYFVRDLKDIREESYDSILELIRQFKLGDNRSIKLISNGFIELKDDQIRIILKPMNYNNYSVMGVFIKKSDNDRKEFKNMFSRPIAKKDDNYTKEVEDYYMPYLEQFQRKGTR